MPTELQGFRLSPQQRRAWTAWRGEEPGCAARCTVLIEGPLEEPTLAAALSSLVRRHGILRTTYHRTPGMPYPLQVVGDGAAVDWGRGDGASLATEPWDLERGPLVRARLHPLAPGRHRLALALPPLAADGATIDNLVREIAQGYAVAAGVTAEEPGEGVSYLQFSEWQNVLAAEDGDPAGKEFWARENAAGAAGLRLPFELPITGRPRFATGSLSRRLDAEVASALGAAAARHGSSLELVLLAAWQTLFWRTTGGAGLPVAVLHRGRAYDVLEDALGLFARWLPLRSRAANGRPFHQLLDELGRGREEALEWLDSLAWADGGPAGQQDFLPVAFELDERPPRRSAGEVSFHLLEKDVCFEPFHLKLCAVAGEGTLDLTLRWDLARFAAQDVERLADGLVRCLESVAGDARTALEDVEILPAAERRRLAAALDGGRRQAPERCFHELFAAQAARTPDAPAVAFEGRSLTYAELDAAANRLARTLVRLGVGPDVLVALYLERSLDIVVALLGVLKASGAYVPLEPSQPRQRLAFMLEDLDAPVAVTHEALEGRLEGFAGKVVRMDRDREAIARESGAAPACRASAGNLAYVIFTSGSTGRPKGVAVEHRQLVAYTTGVCERLELPAGASFANVSTFAADLGHTAIFPALATGGCLHVLSPERVTDGAAVAEYFERHSIDCLKIVPSHLEALRAVPRPERLLPRRRLVLGGEASRPAWIEALQAPASGLRVFNHYGPSETTVGVLTFAAAPGGVDPRCSTLPLGSPIPGIRVHVLDQQMRPLPAWAPGELYVGGDGVSRGYLGRPDLTADRFVPDPFAAAPGERLYRTGDLVRILADGKVEFLGRVDDQVKFHGFRVELAEIRGALNQVPQVRDSVVTMVKDANGRDVLIAYYVSRQALEVAQLRTALRERILEETIPNLFVHLKRLPLTLNGKVNYSALPSLEEARTMVKRVFVAPRSVTEEVMAGIWAEVLGVERVSIHDNFFELGGHSLLATRVISRQREALRVEVPLRSLFETPTVAGLAAALELAGRGAEPPLPAFPALGFEGSVEQQLFELERLSDDEAAGLLDGAAH